MGVPEDPPRNAARPLGPVALETLAPGATFADRYRIEELVGRGAMGVVYRVHDDQLGETVALKLLSVDPKGDIVARFRREVRLARRITHRHVARIHDIGEHAGVHFLSMEYVAGKSLEDVLGGAHPQPPPRVARIALQIASGLAAAHEVEVVHRDLKPANVLIDREGTDHERAVITDFGIARAQREEALTHAAGAFVGTPAYMAPEQVLGEPIDARTDIYAFGLVLYELLTGELPFVRDAEGVFAVAMARVRREPADPRSLAAVPDPLAILAQRCLATKPADRPESALEVVAALERWLSTASGVRGGSSADIEALFRATVVAGHEISDATPTIQSPIGSEPRFASSHSSHTSHAGLAPSSPLDSRPGSSGPFAPLPKLDFALAVLPFRYRGPAEDSYLAEGLGDELIDVLSANHGMRVLSSGATARFKDERDPHAIGAQLGVDAVVDATLQRAGPALRVTVRLIDVKSGVQIWSERYESTVEDALALQDTMSRRIAEALRIEIAAARPGDETPAQAVELYLTARRHMRTLYFSEWELPVSLLDQALAIAPGFRIAMAAHAIGCMRGWWAGAPGGRDWQAQAQASVRRALAQAPELAETHLAGAMLAVQGGDMASAAVELVQALDIAPTFAEAHRYLGDLQCEAGRADEGVKRLKLALELDPGQWSAYVGLARVAALRGERENVERYMKKLREMRGERNMAYVGMAVRFAAWWGKTEELRDLVQTLAGDPDIARQAMVTFGRYVLGGDDNLGMLRGASKMSKNPRMISLVAQMCAEGYGLRNQPELAIQCLRDGAAEALVDVEWLERCPALAELRGRDEFKQVYSTVRSRATGIWKA